MPTKQQRDQEAAAILGIGISFMLALFVLPFAWLYFVGPWQQGSGPPLWAESGIEPDMKPSLQATERTVADAALVTKEPIWSCHKCECGDFDFKRATTFHENAPYECPCGHFDFEHLPPAKD